MLKKGSKFWLLLLFVTQFKAESAKAKENLKKTHKQHSQIFAWKDKGIEISSNIPLMGKQMGVVETVGTKTLGYKFENGIKVFHITAQPIEQWIVKEKDFNQKHIKVIEKITGAHKMKVKQKLRAWGYNGQTPGPTIEVNEGDTIRVIFKNELPEPTSIHWHGIELPYAQDGSNDADPVMPGQTHIYELTLYQSGTTFYHSGYNIARQEMYGLVGFLIIHPKDGYENKIDKDVAIMLQEWAIKPGNIYPNLVSDIGEFNWFTFNGHSAPSIPIINVKQGERVRLRFGTMMMDSHPIHIHGYRWAVVGNEGGPIPKSAIVLGTTINVPVGTTRDVEFVAWNPGLWPLHCHKMHHVMNAHAQVPMGIMSHGGMFTFINVIPNNSNEHWKHYTEKKAKNLKVDAYGFTEKEKKYSNMLFEDQEPLKQKTHLHEKN